MASFIKRKPAPAPDPAAAQSYALMIPEIRTVNLENIKISQDVLALIPENIAIANKMLPLYLTDRGTTLVVAMAAAYQMPADRMPTSRAMAVPEAPQAMPQTSISLRSPMPSASRL